MPTVETRDFLCSYSDDYFGPAWSDPAVILIQAGMGRNGEYWRHWVPGLSGLYRVIRRDMRSHGGSSYGSSPPATSLKALADDVVAFLDVLELERVHYVGESIGGLTGIALGAMYPERLHSLTLVQTPLQLHGVDELMRGSYPSWADAIRALTPGGWVTQHMPPGAAETAWERYQWDRCDTEGLCALVSATGQIDARGDISRIGVPTLILAPAQSHLSPLADQLELRTAIPDAEIEVFEGRGHTVYQDEADRCISRVLKFIECRSPRPEGRRSR